MGKFKKIILLSSILVLALLLTGCGGGDEGPLSWIWNIPLAILKWLFGPFTRGFWKFVSTIWGVPADIVWLAGPIVYLLGAILYIAFVIVILVADLVIGVLCGVLWFILVIFYGIFAGE